MADFVIRNVKFAGLASAVPKAVEQNVELQQFDREEIEKLVKLTGIERRRLSGNELTTSDLCFSAAEAVIAKLNWKKEEIGALVFVTQTPDYILPATSNILQHRLGLGSGCLALDISSGCSGYINGIITLGQLLQGGNIKKGLLLVGDTISKICNPLDKSTYPLFGDAGTATAFEFDEGAPDILANMFSDGAGYDAIIIEDGGYRSPFNEKSLEQCVIDPGIERTRKDLVLNGMDVFTFGITRAPECVTQLLHSFKLEKDQIDYFVFHQANKFMNDTIRKKLALKPEQVPSTLANYGNTSSASIPLTITETLQQAIQERELNTVLCGFGVGLSWGAVYMQIAHAEIADLTEV